MIYEYILCQSSTSHTPLNICECPVIPSFISTNICILFAFSHSIKWKGLESFSIFYIFFIFVFFFFTAYIFSFGFSHAIYA
jgi:hypothetical protein